MGCGASKSTGTGTKRSGARNDNPPIDNIDVPDTNPKYPSPTPPSNSKDDIYKPSDYNSIDAKVKQQVPRLNMNTYDSLIKALTTGCTTDLQKLRAIFVWLFHQDIHGSFYSGVKDPYTPLGYMKLIKTGNGSYASFFAQLCRSADIPCNVIRGVGKGDDYELGQMDVSRLESAWNAVYVSGNWRLIHPLWAYFQEKQTYQYGQRPPAGTKRSSIHEFYWLIDPNRMICFCKPHMDAWQLLKNKWEHKKFLKSPYFTEDYFGCGLMLPKKYNAIIYSDNGLCLIDMDHHDYQEPTIDAHVEFDQEMSGDRMPDNTDMKDYIVKAGSHTRKTVVIRFPVRGRYNLDIYGGIDPKKPRIVEFRLECEDIGWHPQPFPLNPPEGFGLLPIASQFGISDPVPESGIVLVRPAQQKHFSFTCTQRLEVQGTLVHSTVESEKFTDFISTKCTNSEAHVIVAVPDETHLEFGLVIAVRPEGASRQFTPVANYLLVDENWKKKTAVVAPSNKISRNEADRIRQTLIAATQKNDIAKLESAIDEFERNNLMDNGDLTRARHKLVQLHLQNLRKTTLDRELEPLSKAIDAAKKSHVAEDLVGTKEMDDAEHTKLQLKRLKLYMHKVLALNKATISEIHSYQRPRPLVHEVMKATFRLLGDPQRKIQDWGHIQTSMRQLGRNSMINRMKRRDVVHIKQNQIDDAEEYLGKTNKYLVRMTSAGAGTFFVWSNNMISEYQGKGTQEPLSIWNSSNKWEKGPPKKKKVNPNESQASTNYDTPRDQDRTQRDTARDEWDGNEKTPHDTGRSEYNQNQRAPYNGGKDEKNQNPRTSHDNGRDERNQNQRVPYDNGKDERNYNQRAPYDGRRDERNYNQRAPYDGGRDDRNYNQKAPYDGGRDDRNYNQKAPYDGGRDERNYNQRAPYNGGRDDRNYNQKAPYDGGRDERNYNQRAPYNGGRDERNYNQRAPYDSARDDWNPNDTSTSRRDREWSPNDPSQLRREKSWDPNEAPPYRRENDWDPNQNSHRYR